MSFEGACPSCGATVTFDVANSVAAVCASCNSVVGRGDGKLEDYGKVADLVQTDSPLRVGLVGEVRGVPFEVTGRVQLEHAAGGVWDEWYVAFRDGKRWGWLAEAQGKFYLTFPKKLSAEHPIPPIADLALEDRVMVPGAGAMKVVEKGMAKAVAAEGEIPYKFVPGESYNYADLEGPAGKFATLDGSEDPPRIYVGAEFPLARLGISANEMSREQDARQVATESVACPHCGGALEIDAPELTERIACPYCDSLLDVDHGNLKFLKALKQKKIKPLVPLGSTGKLRGREYKVIGFMQRRVKSEGQYYYWTEYLLYTPREPFHWLINSEGHWTLGKPVAAGDVDAAYRSARYKGKTFRMFERSTPVVSAVFGQFYWKVEVGERVGATDYVRPPLTLSREETLATSSAGGTSAGGTSAVVAQAIAADKTGSVPPVVRGAVPPVVGKQPRSQPAGSQEVNYTLGEYLRPSEVEEAFGVKQLPTPRGIAPSQPYPYSNVYRYAGLLIGMALLLGALVAISGGRRKVLEQSFEMTPGQKTFYSEPFALKPRSNIVISCSTPTYNSWVYVSGSLYNEQNSAVKAFSIAVPQSEAGPKRHRDKFLSAVSRGKYTLRLETKWMNDSTASQTLKIQIRQGVPRMKPFFLLLLALSVLPIGVFAYQLLFESMRWNESGIE